MGFGLADEGGVRQLFFEGWEPEKIRRFNPRFSSKLLITMKPPAALAERILPMRRAMPRGGRSARPIRRSFCI